MEKVRPKKHLGQHFLKDQQIAQKIAESLTNLESPRLIEVGPGMGVLTQFLFTTWGQRLEAMDVDAESVAYLKKKWPDFKDQFILKDFLKSDLKSNNGFSVIGNFPYNISSQIFFKVWESQENVNEVVCMIQKEVADRIVAKEGNKTYGILSVLLQAGFDITYLFSVSPNVFVPPPKVQSAVIRLSRKENPAQVNNEFLKRVVKSAFGKRRKTLRNALKDLNLTDTDFSDSFYDQRAEQLSVADFIGLTNRLDHGRDAGLTHV